MLEHQYIKSLLCICCVKFWKCLPVGDSGIQIIQQLLLELCEPEAHHTLFSLCLAVTRAEAISKDMMCWGLQRVGPATIYSMHIAGIVPYFHGSHPTVAQEDYADQGNKTSAQEFQSLLILSLAARTINCEGHILGHKTHPCYTSQVWQMILWPNTMIRYGGSSTPQKLKRFIQRLAHNSLPSRINIQTSRDWHWDKMLDLLAAGRGWWPSVVLASSDSGTCIPDFCL
jgi:hypothetical protein